MMLHQYFWLQKLDGYKEVSTLGPEGTSSQAAAAYLSDLLDQPLSVKLFDSFEQAANYTELNSRSILLVANAYRDVDLFYMTPDLKLAGSFFYTPPNYYLCCRNESDLKMKLKLKKRLRLSTHKAPSSRIPHILDSTIEAGWAFDLSKVEITFRESTADAALTVIEGESDLCLVNENSIKLYGLSVISSPMVIEMVWSVFSKTTSDPIIYGVGETSTKAKDKIENTI